MMRIFRLTHDWIRRDIVGRNGKSYGLKHKYLDSCQNWDESRRNFVRESEKPGKTSS
jgi:hypothetical protein